MKVETIDRYNRQVYEDTYTPAHLTLDGLDGKELDAYTSGRNALRFRMLEKYAAGKSVLDVGCGVGAFLVPFVPKTKKAVGIDFSLTMLNALHSNLEEMGGEVRDKTRLVNANARYLPFADNSFEALFSYATLYHIPRIGDILKEMQRVLKPGGVALFELGNLWSLTTLVNKFKNPTKIAWFHISYWEMQQLIGEAGLKVIEYWAMQLLPLYYGGPRYIGPPLNRVLRTIMGQRVGGKMLDEVLSGIPPLRYVAFRHLFVCQKE